MTRQNGGKIDAGPAPRTPARSELSNVDGLQSLPAYVHESKLLQLDPLSKDEELLIPLSLEP
jgi:hypothetical protein